MAKNFLGSEIGKTALEKLVSELAAAPRQIIEVETLLAEGNTIPFIARYRKEAHGELDEVKISRIQETLIYHRELEERRKTVLNSISEQGKLTDELTEKIRCCATKTALEDLYMPYKPKRRTRASIAREKGLEPLAEIILSQSDENPEFAAERFIDQTKDVNDISEALAGAGDIVAEMVAENAEVRGMVRKAFADEGVIISEAVEPRPAEPTKFEQYYEFKEKASQIPSHRFLAIRRGQAEGVLKVRLTFDSKTLLLRIAEICKKDVASPFADNLQAAIDDSFKRLIAPSVEIDVLVEMKLKADRAAVEIFARNLRNLLLQSPLGSKSVIGVDPGLRTGCKCAALDATGKFLETRTIYPSQGERKAIEAKVEICKMVAKYRPYAFAVGNGTGGRDTETFVRSALREANVKDVHVISVNESGASVYSASEVAREEFPGLDLTIRGAVSIGRRLQDPLAELVKIDPKAIGVGQYQHDVHQPLLAAKLDEVVVSCVNHVGVELNTASYPLLTRVSGIGPAVAKRLISYRDEKGAFTSRSQICKVPGLGPKTFEQAAGFLRIRGGLNPLDASAVHPERYELVERMASDLGVKLHDLIGNAALVDKIPLSKYVSDSAGEATVRDILAELKKPGRDPRDTFKNPEFREDVTEIAHVREGMTLEGVVTNVTAFGAFVDVGVHQDGLVHVSELSDRYVSDPSEVVKAGDRIKVRVLSVDLQRKRISLSAKSQAPKAERTGNDTGARRAGAHARTGSPRPRSAGRGFTANPFANL
ncbi:MAG: Tex family protein [Kiritimatiellae bacterium]|nr:Tex family protein [Kiritimatiellia bacterium]